MKELTQICGNCGLQKSEHEGTGFNLCPKPFGGTFHSAVDFRPIAQLLANKTELNEQDRERIEQEAYTKAHAYNSSMMNIEWQAYYKGYRTGAEYATIYEREQQAPPQDIDEPDWNKLAALKPPENLGGAYHGCWLEGAAQGYSKCMITIVAEWRRRYYQSEVVKKQLEAERSELKTLLGDILAGFQQFGTIYSKDEERIKEAIK